MALAKYDDILAALAAGEYTVIDFHKQFATAPQASSLHSLWEEPGSPTVTETLTTNQWKTYSGPQDGALPVPDPPAGKRWYILNFRAISQTAGGIMLIDRLAVIPHSYNSTGFVPPAVDWPRYSDGRGVAVAVVSPGNNTGFEPILELEDASGLKITVKSKAAGWVNGTALLMSVNKAAFSGVKKIIKASLDSSTYFMRTLVYKPLAYAPYSGSSLAPGALVPLQPGCCLDLISTTGAANSGPIAGQLVLVAA